MFKSRAAILIAVIFAVNHISPNLFAAKKSGNAQNQTTYVHSYGWFIDSQSGQYMYGHHYFPATQAQSASAAAFTAPVVVQSTGGLIGLSPGFFSNAGNIPIASQAPPPTGNTPAPVNNCDSNTAAISDARKRINDANDILAKLEAKNSIKLNDTDAPATAPSTPTPPTPAPSDPPPAPAPAPTATDISDLIQTLLTTVLKNKLTPDQLTAVLNAIDDATAVIGKSPAPARNSPDFIQTVLGKLLKSPALNAIGAGWPGIVDVILGALSNGSGAGAQSAGVDYKDQLKQLKSDFTKANK